MEPQVLIVGAGPAGLSAALWCRTLGVEAVVLEAADRPGGQLHQIHGPIENYPGLRGTGAELAAALERHAREAGVAVRRGAEAVRLGPDGTVTLADGERLRADRLVVASGAAPRRLGIPGELELAGRGVSTSATRDRAAVAGQPVLVVGGGDAAFENALLLAEVGCRVTLAVRESEPRARADFRRRVARQPEIEVLLDTAVETVLGEDRVRAARLAGARGAAERPFVAVFVKVGVEPGTAWCRDALRHDAEGYLVVDREGRTSLAGVWAAGDVVRASPPSIASAVGAGARAAAAAAREAG